jgi:hypothetical protein
MSTLVSSYSGDRYARLARVLRYTAMRCLPDWTLTIAPSARLFEAYNRADGHDALPHGAQLDKMQVWRRAVRAAPDGAELLLIDADTFLLRALDDVWRIPFDLAYTTHDPAHSRWPLNAGVLFLRVTPATRAFFAAWCRGTDRMGRATKTQREDARQRYGSWDQYILAELIQHERGPLHVHALPCLEWNCCDPEWAHRTDATRILHVKGSLRAAIFGAEPGHHRRDVLPPLCDLWHRLEQEAVEMPVQGTDGL